MRLNLRVSLKTYCATQLLRCAGVTTSEVLGILMYTATLTVPVRSSPCI